MYDAASSTRFAWALSVVCKLRHLLSWRSNVERARWLTAVPLLVTTRYGSKSHSEPSILRSKFSHQCATTIGCAKNSCNTWNKTIYPFLHRDLPIRLTVACGALRLADRRLELAEEVEILRKLAEFPELVSRAAAAREPHHLAYYLRDLAGLWNPYVQDGRNHRVLSEDQGLTSARLGLALAVRTVLGNGLELLGISAPERM